MFQHPTSRRNPPVNAPGQWHRLLGILAIAAAAICAIRLPVLAGERDAPAPPASRPAKADMPSVSTVPVRLVITIDYAAPGPLDRAAEAATWADALASCPRSFRGMVMTIRPTCEALQRLPRLRGESLALMP